MYRQNRCMILALLIVGLLHGCGDPKDTRMIDFRVKDYPADVASVSGISGNDSEGRWTEGPRAVVQFTKALPSAFQLKLQVFRAFGPNGGVPISIRVGGVEKEFTVTKLNQLILLDFEGVGKSDRIEIMIPKPTSPKELGEGDDTRMLGLHLVSLAIGPKGGK